MMLLGLWIKVAWMLFVVLIGAALLFWGWRRGQFHDAEEAKYRMLEDRDPAPWPAGPTQKEERK